MDYKNRIVDTKLELKLETFGATLIVGPKGCGKTTTAKHRAKSVVEFQDENERENNLQIANTHPSDLLKGEKPRLFDEWQDAPKIWGAVRKSVDDEQETGLYILTGSTSNGAETPHTGTLRISRMKMLPMSLYESGESNGEISLIELFNNPESFESCHSDITFDELKFLICRGGWPLSIRQKTERSALAVAKDLFLQTCEVDISNIDGTKRNPRTARTFLKSYARNICTLAETNTILNDINANAELSKTTYYEYLAALENLFIIEDVDAWNSSIRSKFSLRSTAKRNIVDPSIAAAALSISPEYFDRDYRTLGFLFESLCIRDLKIYSSNNDGQISYYRDRSKLEADVVLHLEDGRYALIEVKLGQNEVDKAAEHLCQIENKIKKYNNENPEKAVSLPNLKIIITGTQYGYRRDDGVFVIPIGCLKD